MRSSPLQIDRLKAFPDFRELPDDAARSLVSRLRVTHVDAGTTLVMQGSPCAYFPLVLSGQARIYVTDPDGREITLYRLGPGQGCVLAAACAICNLPLPGSVDVETGGEGLFIPAPLFRDWVEHHSFWRDYAFSLIAHQLGKVLAVTNDLAFRNLDSRIAAFLLQQVGESDDSLRMTHQQLADELGTRREVTSRILKQMENQRLVHLARGHIQIIDRSGLRQRAAPAAFAFSDKSY